MWCYFVSLANGSNTRAEPPDAIPIPGTSDAGALRSTPSDLHPLVEMKEGLSPPPVSDDELQRRLMTQEGGDSATRVPYGSQMSNVSVSSTVSQADSDILDGASLHAKSQPTPIDKASLHKSSITSKFCSYLI